MTSSTCLVPLDFFSLDGSSWSGIKCLDGASSPRTQTSLPLGGIGRGRSSDVTPPLSSPLFLMNMNRSKGDMSREGEQFSVFFTEVTFVFAAAVVNDAIEVVEQ